MPTVRPTATTYTDDSTPSDMGARFAGDMLARVKSWLRVEQPAREPEQTDEYRMLHEIFAHKSELEAEQARLRELYRRFDNLYYANTIDKDGGADHWPEGKPKGAAGRVHISVNAHAVYVDIPASLQAVEPIMNYVPGPGAEEREAAARREQLFWQWWDDDDLDLKADDICRIKGLYGDAAVKVYWDPIEKRPTTLVLESLENLYLGWGDSNFRRLDWAIYCYGLSPQAVEETYGVDVEMKRAEGGGYYPWVTRSSADHADPLDQLSGGEERQRQQTAYEKAQVHVYDYWYKRPAGAGKKPTIWNCIYVGNYMVKPPTRHKEYDNLPFVLISNAKVPGQPTGRSDLYDVEQILREKDERLTQAAQMIHQVIRGQMWQLVGPDAPDDVPANAIPQPNKVATPGSGNEIRTIQPFMPQFAVEDFLTRLDREAATITGLNDLLLGLAPAGALNSSKAIAALTANFVARVNPKRKLLYRGYRDIWDMAATIWERKSTDIRAILDGQHRISIKAPDLTPRDELETAQMAVNLIQNRIWSSERGMDATGVEDPSEEKGLIREEQTDASLNPAAVQAMAQLMVVFQQLGIGAPPGAEELAGQQAQSLNTQRTLNPNAPGTPSLNAPENAGNAPPESQPANAGLRAQTLLQGGEAQGRILSQQEI